MPGCIGRGSGMSAGEAAYLASLGTSALGIQSSSGADVRTCKLVTYGNVDGAPYYRESSYSAQDS